MPLPDPSRGHESATCLRCDYSLAGLAPPGRCPECGLEIPDPEATLRLWGVAQKTESLLWRRVCWVLISVVAFGYFQGVFIISMTFPWASLVMFLGIVGAVVAMIVTGSGGKRSTERFVFTTDGFGRSVMAAGKAPGKGDGEGARSFEMWGSEEEGRIECQLKRVSSMWSKLKLIRHGVGGKRVLLDAGVRCTDADREWVGQTLEVLMGHEVAELLPPMRSVPPPVPPLSADAPG